MKSAGAVTPQALASHWARALALAESAIGLSDPNPRVGCVLTDAAGERVLGEGHTQAAGQAHAEVMALRDAGTRGHDVKHAQVFVTLEPCAHHGRTPPCADALVQAGVGSVHIACGDPNPLVAGQGIARLRAAGIGIVAAPPQVHAAAVELNIGFLHRQRTGQPWVRAKAATSADGRTALPDGQSRWITGEAARADGHRFRARAGAILTGIGTVLADDPALTVRLDGAAAPQRQPLCVVVDAALRTPLSARVLAHPGGTWLVHAQCDPARQAALAGAGVHLLALPDAARPGRVDLPALLAALAQAQVNEVHVEAGAGLNGALATQDLIDDWLLYVAPLWLGHGPGSANLPLPPALAQAPRGQWLHAERIGIDLRCLLRMHPPPTIPVLA